MQRKSILQQFVAFLMLVLLVGCPSLPKPPTAGLIPPAWQPTTSLSSVGGHTYYVSPDGSDSNSGSEDAPFQTLQQAANGVEPGDTVLVMDGTYGPSEPDGDGLAIGRSGTAERPITFQAAPGQHPVIRATGWKGITVQEAAYIVVRGFEIVGNRPETTLTEALADKDNPDNRRLSNHGIEVYKSHHVLVDKNTVRDMNGNGISAVRSDYITIENNVTFNNAWYSCWGNSGITTYQPWNFDNDTSAAKIVIRNNRVYGNQNLVPFYRVGEVTDGNGIILDDHRCSQGGCVNGAYTGKTVVENNVVYGNGGRGIHAFYADNIVIRNNTIVGNLLTESLRDDSGNLNLYETSNVEAKGNIIAAESNVKPTSIDKSQNAEVSDNFIGDPLFINPEAGDFTLSPDSPAMGFGATIADTNLL
jgi:parallel beta-helix repeat protein